MSVKPIPNGYSTITPHLVIKGCSEAIDFYKKAFDAEELFRMAGPDGRIMHGEIRIGNSIVMVSDEFPEMKTGYASPKTLGGMTGGMFLYVEDCDAAFRKAVDAGASGQMPPQDMFWGDRYGRVVDPYGHTWAIATHKEDVAPEEMRRRQEEWMKQAQGA